MTKHILFILLAALFFGSTIASAHPHILRLADRTEIGFEQMIEDLKQARVVFVGEFHDHIGHHRAQLAVLDALFKSGADLSIGLEMFRKNSQQTLDLWTGNQISENRFLATYNQNWSMWPKYRDLFVYAKDFGIPMVGLNIPDEVSKQVATKGIASLSDQQNEARDQVACTIDPIYMNFIRRAMGGHGGHGESFVYFCEAQLLWDVAMARNLEEYLGKQPKSMAVVLAGSGHSWKYGIPSRMNTEISPIRIVLPEIPGRLNCANATADDADYLWLDEGMAGWATPDRFNGPVRSLP